MKTPERSSGVKTKRDAVHAEPKKSLRRLSAGSDAASAGPQVPEKSDPANRYKTALRGYRFHRAKTPGIIEVLNEHSYVMAEYSQRTGSVKWQRMVLASQREQIEKWLEHHYPSA